MIATPLPHLRSLLRDALDRSKRARREERGLVPPPLERWPVAHRLAIEQARTDWRCRRIYHLREAERLRAAIHHARKEGRQ